MSNKSKKGNGNGGDGQSKLAKQRSQVMQTKAEIGPHILPAVFMVDTNTSYARLFAGLPGLQLLQGGSVLLLTHCIPAGCDILRTEGLYTGSILHHVRDESKYWICCGRGSSAARCTGAVYISCLLWRIFGIEGSAVQTRLTEKRRSCNLDCYHFQLQRFCLRYLCLF